MKQLIQLLTYLLFMVNTLTAQWTQTSGPQFPAVPLNILNMKIDGNNQYAVAYNALYKSTDNGGSWTRIYGGKPDYTESIAWPYFVEASGSTICIPVSNYNTGINKVKCSANGGTSFQQSMNNFGYPISALLVDGSKVFVMDDHGFYMSNNSGLTFTDVGLTSPGSLYNYPADLRQTQEGKILIFTELDPNSYAPLGAYIYRSTDNVNWEPINVSGGSNPLPCGQNGQYAYFSTLGYFNGSILVGLYNGDGTGALYESPDLGENWYPVGGPFDYYCEILAYTDGRIYALGDDFSTIYISTDGATWASSPAPVNEIFNVTPLDGSGTKFVGGGTYYQGGSWHSTNNGATWTQNPNSPASPDQGVIYDYISEGNTKFMVTHNHGVFRGTGNNPANTTWTPVLANGVNGGGDTGWGKKGNTLLAGIDYFGAGDGGIFRSTNNGNSWTKTHTGVGLCFLDDGNEIFAGVDYDGIFKSTNHGQTWTAVNNGLPSETYLRSTSDLIRSGNNLVASFFFGGIYYKPGNSSTWVQSYAPGYIFGEQFYCMAKAGSTLFAGSNLGLIKSMDDGESWEYVQNGLDWTNPVTFLYVKDDDELYIGTGTGGILRSTDGGQTFVTYNDGAVPNNYVSFIGKDGPNLLAGWNWVPETLFSYYYYHPGQGLWCRNAAQYIHAPNGGNDPDVVTTSQLRIFPNPVSGSKVQFRLNADLEQVAGAKIMSIKGEVLVDEPTLYRPEMEVGDLSAGMYFLQVTLQGGVVLRQPFIVQKNRQ